MPLIIGSALRGGKQDGAVNFGSRRLFLEPIEDRALLAAVFAEFVDPHPVAGNQFGAIVQPPSTGNGQ